MNEERVDDPVFRLAHQTWRQFYRYRIDLPAPTQPEIDARLIRHRRVEETEAMGCFITASILLLATARAATDIAGVLRGSLQPLDAPLFLLACGIFIAAALHALRQGHSALQHHQLATRIHVDGVPWDSVRSMFADTRDTLTRDYLTEVRLQGRSLRRAEAAVLIERLRSHDTDEIHASESAFRAAIRGRTGVRPRELATGALFVIVILLAGPAGRAEPALLLPGLFVLGAWAMADIASTLVRFAVDPWQLRDGLEMAGQLRLQLLRDLSAPLAIVVGVTALHAGAGGLF